MSTVVTRKKAGSLPKTKDKEVRTEPNPNPDPNETNPPNFPVPDVADNAAFALYYDHGLTSIGELEELDGEQVIQTCKNIRRPGHMIPNPNRGRNNQANEIHAPGFAVSPRAEMNLKLTLYWLKYRVNTTRVTTPQDVTLDEIRSVKQLKEWEQKHKAPEATEKLVNPSDWNKTFEAISDYLRMHIGIGGVPLAYVIRENVEATQDPVDGWDTFQIEMENRAPITDPVRGGRHANFLLDNQKVWDILSKIVTDTECWTYAKKYRTKKDGRAAYLALYKHYLGENNRDTMADKAEAKLASLTYDGEKKRWNWEKFVSSHLEQHQILEGLEKYGYKGLDEQSKVRHLHAGIKTRELDAVRTQILASPNLRRNFDAATTLYADFIRANSALNLRHVQIAQVETERPSKKPKVEEKPSKETKAEIGVNEVKDRYYTREEYRKLSHEAKGRLKELRAKREAKKEAKKGKGNERNVSEVSTTPVDKAEDVKPDDATEVTSNRTNPALNRQNVRNVSAIRTINLSHVNISKKESCTELDTHADTCIVGANVMIVADHGRPVTVTSYDSKAGPKTYRTVDAAIAYDDPNTGETKIVMINQAIHIPHLSHNLINPMQIRMNDVTINDIPKFLVEAPDNETHAIAFPEETRGGERYTIPLSLRGVVSYFPSRKPTLAEYNGEFGNYLALTYEAPEWDPSSPTFAQREAAMTDWKGRVRERKSVKHQIFALSTKPSKGDEDWNHGILESANILSLHDLYSSKPTSSVQEVNTKPGKPDLSAEDLAKRWGIGIETAKSTLQKTTQRGTRSVLHPSLSRRYTTNDRHLRYRRLPVDLYCDTLKSSVKSRRGNTYAQVYCARNGWKRTYGMGRKSDAVNTLAELFTTCGVPATMIMDGSKEQTQGKFRQLARESHCHIRTTEPYSPWSNAAEQAIKELKLGVTRKMRKMCAPLALWDDCLELEALIQSHTASSVYGNQGKTPETKMFGETADISQLCEIGFYDWVMFRDTMVPFPDSKLVLGRYLGPSMGIGPAMTAKILKSNGEVVHRSTYRSLTPDEIRSNEEKLLRDKFDADIKSNEKLGLLSDASNSFVPDDDLKADIEPTTWDLYEDDSGELHRHAIEDEVTPEEGDVYIAAQVLLPIGSEEKLGTVKRRKRGLDGQLRGTANDNPILDTRTYEIEFPDGQVAEYSANVLAENMWSQSDVEGRQYLLLKEIVDHKKDEDVAVRESERWITVNNRKHARKSTRGWSICVLWADGSQSWETLADVKESFPLEVAQYAEAKGLLDETAFHWWAPLTIKRAKRIVAAVNTRYQKTTHKFGIKVPKTVAQAQALDKENGDTQWMDAVRLELANVKVAFKVLDEGEDVPQGYQQLDGHFVFTVKMESFKRKARWVAGASGVETPKELTYASVVSRESVRIALTLAALNDLQVIASDVQNAYLTAPTTERIWTVLGPEWGELAGRKAIIVRALYGLKSSGASFRNHLADCMRTLGYHACLADPDVWYKEETREEDGHQYYAYVLLYVDDCLVIHHEAMKATMEINHYFPMKKDSIGQPKFYLGAKVVEATLENGVKAWGMSSSKYIQEAVRKVEEKLEREGRKLIKKAPTPFPLEYSSELDTSKELEPEEANFYQSQIGILRWMVELGRIDIMTEVSMLASHLAMPREGHMEAALRIFAYLKNKHNARVIFDPSYPVIDDSKFQKCDWRHFYGDVKEPIPLNAPKSRGKEVDLRLFVDSSHADDKVNRRSRSGHFIFINNSPIAWLSKKQATVETSVFGAEFVALKIGVEAIRGLRYKLRMMGVPLAGPAYVYGDNLSVITNVSKPESTLKKKSNSICYHAVRESVAMGEIVTAHISTHENVADLATKVIPGGQKREYLLTKILFDLYDEEHPSRKKGKRTHTK
eukprot:Nitzschia sp. Nitz4//scaffold260_size33533//228//6137//NITZ4_007876-RA/size33533-snap-gene-0.41-mRNA-1//-1//CDS//3329544674//8117//frame0